MNQKALCIISRYPKIEWITFLSRFENYDVYIVADDNSSDYSSIYKDFSNIKILQFKEKECEDHGFAGSVNGTLRGGPSANEKNVLGWDKAFYYFAKINNSHEYVWFLEDDVFIYDETSISKIDYQYINQDLLSTQIGQDLIGDNNLAYPSGWWWHKMYTLGNFKPEGMFYKCCAFHIRLSKNFIKKIEDYADEYKTLFFVEAFIPITCMKNNLSFAHPREFMFSRASIELNENTKKIILNGGEDYFFHPIKNVQEHEMYRKKI
jgi:hypothetical protein